MGRPKNMEKYSPQAQREQLKVLCGDALAQMRRMIKEADFQTLANFVTKTLPLIINEEEQNVNDVTMELLIQKAVKVKMRIKEANEQNIKEEEIE